MTITAQNAVRESVTGKITGDADAALISARRVQMICVWDVTNADKLKINPMEKISGIIIDGKVYEVIEGECNKHCAFWNDKLCENLLWYCTEKSCYFRYSPELTDKLKGK